MGEAARRADATIVISPHQQQRGHPAARARPGDACTCVPDGVDVERFAVRRAGTTERRARWLDWLVRDPQGWDEASRTPGSIRYTEDEVVDAFFDAAHGRAAAGADVRRALPGFQARAAARARVRPRARTDVRRRRRS